jgi:hypothetical protein
MKCIITPVITGVTGMVTKGSKKNLEATPGKHSTDSLQKTAVLVTSHILRKVLQSETGSLSVGESQLVEAERYRGEKACGGDDDDDDDDDNLSLTNYAILYQRTAPSCDTKCTSKTVCSDFFHLFARHSS